MTSTTIVVLIFGFGALTYYFMQRDNIQPNSGNTLTDRLLLNSSQMNEGGGGGNAQLEAELNALELNEEVVPGPTRWEHHAASSQHPQGNVHTPQQRRS